MTTFEMVKRAVIGRRLRTPLVCGVVVALLLCSLAIGARAETRGFPLPGLSPATSGAGDVLSFLGYPRPINAGNPPTPVDLTNTQYGFIFNEYLAFVQGTAGAFSQTLSPTLTANYTIPGRIAFGNVRGSLRPEIPDDKNSLTGLYIPTPPFILQWPLASLLTTPGGVSYTGYVAASVDGAGTSLGFNGYIQTPQFRDNVLESVMDAGNGVQVRQEVRLLRSKARMTWTITNTDAQPHAVILQFALPHYGAEGYVEPRGGFSRRAALFSGANVPSELRLVSERVNPEFHAVYQFTGFGATRPDQVFVSEGAFYAGETFRLPNPTAISTLTVAAVGVYWNLGSIPAGGTRTVVTYFGNGAATEDPSRDLVVGTEATESLFFNTQAALTPGAPNATLADAARFLSPRPFTIFGAVYNQTLQIPGQEVVFNNVTMSVTLPQGLRFATDPATGVADTTSKSVGEVRGDSEGTAQWLVEPTGDRYGALNYILTVSAPPVPPRTVSRVINVPATPLKTVTAADFQLISFPFAFDPALSNNGDASTVLSGITQPADPPQPRIFEYLNNPDQPYRFAARVQPGNAYFYKPAQDKTIFLKGAVPISSQAPLNGDAVPFQRTLSPGWNMVGNPYVYEIPLGFLRFARPENVTQSFGFAEAVTAGLVRSGFFFYRGGGNYDFLQSSFDPLTPWVGYWVFANTPVVLIFTTPPQLNSAILPSSTTGGFEPTRKAGALASRSAFVKNPTMDEWKVQLVARNQQGSEDGATLMGVSRQAKDGDDVRDLPKPPAFRDYVYIGIERDDVKTRYAQDLKAPGSSKSWNLELISDQAGPVTVTWPNTAVLPRRLRLKLTDLETGKSYDLRRSSAISVNVAKETPHRFRLTADNAPSSPLAISSMRTVTTKGSGGGYSIDFELTRSAAVTGRVLTLNGKVVRTLAVGRAATAGRNTLRWDSRSQEGGALPAGPYAVEITARDDDGGVATRRATVLMLR